MLVQLRLEFGRQFGDRRLEQARTMKIISGILPGAVSSASVARPDRSTTRNRS